MGRSGNIYGEENGGYSEGDRFPWRESKTDDGCGFGVARGCLVEDARTWLSSGRQKCNGGQAAYN